VPVVADVELKLEVAAFLEAQGEAMRHPRAQELSAWAVEEARGLVAPGLVYEWVPAEVVGEREVRLGGVLMRVGRHAELMLPAQEAFVAVATIGAALEERARELAGAAKTFDSYVLGEVGVFAVGALMLRAHHLVEEQAAQRGWGVGAELAPGQLAGWDVGEQNQLCSLLDIAAIGVSVTGGGMLMPQKSASLVVGAGPGYAAQEVRSPCEFCAQGASCRYRH